MTGAFWWIKPECNLCGLDGRSKVVEVSNQILLILIIFHAMVLKMTCDMVHRVTSQSIAELLTVF